MPRRITVSTLLAAALLQGASPAMAQDKPDVTPISQAVKAKIDSVFDAYGPDGPGCALGVTQDLKPVYTHGYGLADLDQGVAMSPDTAFDIASVSKQFTAMSVIILAHDGKISLDDDVRKYVPELPVYGAPITIRDLIHHTSGLRDIYVLRSLMGLTEKDYFTQEEFLDDIGRQKQLIFPTGQQWRYSNTGYLLLGMVVQRVTHETLAQYAREKIFAPLNMSDTFFADDATRIVRRRATGYYRRADGGYKRGVTLFEMVGDGGVVSTVHDLMLWDRDFYDGKVWRPEIKAAMLLPGRLADGQLAMAGDGAYAGGLVVGRRRGLNYVRHSGSFVGFKTDQIRFPDQKLGVTVLCNRDDANAPGLAERVADILLAPVFAQPAPETAPVAAPAQSHPPVPGDLIDALVGAYHADELGVNYRIERTDGGLRILMGKRAAPLDFGDYAASPPWLLGPDTIGDEVFAFKIVRTDGKISGFDMSLVGGTPMMFTRLP